MECDDSDVLGKTSEAERCRTDGKGRESEMKQTLRSTAPVGKGDPCGPPTGKTGLSAAIKQVALRDALVMRVPRFFNKSGPPGSRV